MAASLAGRISPPSMRAALWECPRAISAGEMRVIDIYRRAGEKLSENWIFIDLLHFWKGLGIDILARSAQLSVPSVNHGRKSRPCCRAAKDPRIPLPPGQIILPSGDIVLRPPRQPCPYFIDF